MYAFSRDIHIIMVFEFMIAKAFGFRSDHFTVETFGVLPRSKPSVFHLFQYFLQSDLLNYHINSKIKRNLNLTLLANNYKK